MAPIIWTAEARLDLDEITDYIARDSEHYAQAVADKIFNISKSIPTQPMLGRMVPEVKREDIRERFIYSYRLIYQLFDIDIETCRECGGAVKVIACIENPVVIQKILTHLKEKVALEPTGLLPAVRAPPPVCVQRTGRQVGLFNSLSKQATIQTQVLRLN